MLPFSVTGPAAVLGCWSPQFSNFLTLASPALRKWQYFPPFSCYRSSRTTSAYTDCILTLTAS